MSNNELQKWYHSSGPEGDVVLSTRIRLARNLATLPFPDSMSREQRKTMVDTVREAMKEQDLVCLEMENVSANDALSLVERHLVSPDFVRDTSLRSLFLSRDESVSVMVGEEDHLRIQVMQSGLQLEEAYSAADALDSALDVRLSFAFDERLGYLTQCPTNLGTGMRASLMLHLPALQETGAVRNLANTVSKLGLTMRGLYGEGSRPDGAVYQLSNQITLGISESEAIRNLSSIVMQIIKEERLARKNLCENARFADTVCRSLGVLRYAKLLSYEELLSLSAYLRVGISGGILPETLSFDRLNMLMNDTQPATLMMLARKEMAPEERDALRAEQVKKLLE